MITVKAIFYPDFTFLSTIPKDVNLVKNKLLVGFIYVRNG